MVTVRANRDLVGNNEVADWLKEVGHLSKGFR